MLLHSEGKICVWSVILQSNVVGLLSPLSSYLSIFLYSDDALKDQMYRRYTDEIDVPNANNSHSVLNLPLKYNRGERRLMSGY